MYKIKLLRIHVKLVTTLADSLLVTQMKLSVVLRGKFNIYIHSI